MTVDTLIDKWEEAWSGKDEAAFADVCTPDIHYEDPVTVEPLEGPEELGSHAARLWAAFPDARVERTGERPQRKRQIAQTEDFAGVLDSRRGRAPERQPGHRDGNRGADRQLFSRE